ncbi:hypothetical protein SETIT_8G240500v2 [Setaria italica]|uniref:DUF4220 domain-containing protein n=1 Tax=Setaria italica TaxID=4555 RepID=K3ZNM5_SETIT|nr:uncharacterized protein LOC111258361 [Setaria italica]RCV39649.1 hypothetical protein SETIT_8G240500v2 [Setaria italica]
MALAPSPPPSPTNIMSSHEALEALLVVALVLLAVVAIFLLHILSPLRRWLSHGLPHHIVMGIYTLSYPLVGYTIGRMQSSIWYPYDYTVWAVFLLLLLSSTDSLTACRLEDIDSWKSIYVKQLFKGFLLVFIILKIVLDIHGKQMNADKLLYPLSAILFVIVIKSYLMIASMRMVSKSYLGKNVKVIAEYMHYIDNKLVAFDPVTMESYRYMVAGDKHCVNRPGQTPWYKKPDDLKVTTVEQIWQCKGNLLIGDQGKVLKDLCLSMALSKMLNRRFAGFKLSEAELEKTHDFVFKGLLAGDELQAFRVIEEELVFVHDMYFTRYSYLYQKGRYRALCLPVIMIALCSWLTVTSLHERRKNRFQKSSVFVLGYPTIVTTVVLALLEAYQLYLYMASGWFKVALIRSYVTTPFLQTSCCSEMIIRLLLMLKPFRPWKGRLGQYCFLEHLGSKSKVMNCLHYGTLCFVDKAMKGSKNSVKLSEDVKKAIIDSLLASNGHLTNGVTSLQRNSVHDDLKWPCDATATDGAVAHTIVVWHIATTLCEQKLDKQTKEEDAVKTSSTLSKYCMHLLAFAPNLLPDHSSISESILDQSINEASKLLKEGKNKKIKGKDKKIKGKNKKIEGRCEILMETTNTDGCVDDETRLVAQGVHLARQLIDNIQDSTTRWKVLSDFWAEMMLYVSPSDDAREHLEVLAKGGEFITHLWALLTHAGVLKRGPTEPMDAV